MKHKLLYGISGLLALCVLGITVFAPDFYFLYWDWDRKNEVQSENLYFSEQMDPLDISQELELLAMFQLSDSSSDHLYQYTETFLPTEREIPENALFQSIRQQFFQLKDNFNETPFFSSICETLSKIDQDHIVNSYLCQLVNLETTTYGFSMWKVHVETECSDLDYTLQGDITLDAITGTVLGWDLNFWLNGKIPQERPFQEVDDIYDYYDRMMRGLFRTSSYYWALNSPAEYTRYYVDTGQWYCDVPDSSFSTAMTVEQNHYFTMENGQMDNRYRWCVETVPRKF